LLDEKASKDLLDHICSMSGFSEGELLMNYDLLEKSLYRVLRKGADIILYDPKRELLIQVVLIDPNITTSEIVNPRLGVGDIPKRIRTIETLEFVRKIPSHNHISFLYTNDNSKDNILAAFFDTMIDSDSTGLFSLKNQLTIILVTLRILCYMKNSYRSLESMKWWQRD